MSHYRQTVTQKYTGLQRHKFKQQRISSAGTEKIYEIGGSDLMGEVFTVEIRGTNPICEGIVDVLSLRGFVRAIRDTYRKSDMLERTLTRTINSNGSIARAFLDAEEQNKSIAKATVDAGKQENERCE
ncbi:hypothetical protein MPC4_70098 [Methylocella tundrae]|uniref:Uncharacterized protein n=1 Tax=Methylocella tundrae TaxID=227605 RepID=A0A8B6MB44_METTU|nr:hypothetical protein [Methylocella tundrae]VTZ27185.1 hypothetical protein MPC1_4880002 [Methylocella tundrae]VTZ52210.1 hypothetical protein MPC4_70098 [Methylocella tundrae]